MGTLKPAQAQSAWWFPGDTVEITRHTSFGGRGTRCRVTRVARDSAVCVHLVRLRDGELITPLRSLLRLVKRGDAAWNAALPKPPPGWRWRAMPITAPEFTKNIAPLKPLVVPHDQVDRLVKALRIIRGVKANENSEPDAMGDALVKINNTATRALSAYEKYVNKGR